MNRAAHGLLLLLLSAWPLRAEVPPSTGKPVSDFADVLDDAAEAELTALSADLERRTTIELAVVTVPSLEGRAVEEYAERLFNTWHIGQKGKDNGVLVLVAPADRQMRIEVGYGLEGVLPDGLAGRLIREQFLPSFKAGDYSAGVRRGVWSVAQALDPGGERAEPAAPAPQAVDGQTVLLVALAALVGFFLLGAGAGARSGPTLMQGVIFGGLSGAALINRPGLPAAPIWGVGGLSFLIGLILGLMRPQSFRPAHGRSAGGWIWGGPRGGGGSSGGGSFGGGFGGGFSGGGGASGRW